MMLRTRPPSSGHQPSGMKSANTVAANLDEIARIAQAVLISTTPSLEGHRITRYLDVDYAEVTVNLTSAIGSVVDPTQPLDRQNVTFDSPAGHMKRHLLNVLRYKAHLRGGNAVVGVSLTTVLLPNGLVRLEAVGTAVVVEV